MKVGNLLLLTGGAGLAYYLYTTAKGVKQNLTVQILTGGFKSISRKEITGSIEFRIINPEKASLTINNTFFKLFANNSEIGTAQTETPVNIGKVSAKTFQVNFSLPILSVLNSVPGLIDSLADGNTKFALQGFVDTNLGRINIEQSL